jgi:uncharacterized protein YukE
MPTRILRYLVVAVAVFVAVLWSSAGLRAGERAGTVSALLSDAQRAAVLASWATAEMEQYQLSQVGWETHTTKLTEIRELVNTVARKLTRLNELRSEASPEQRKEIDRLASALQPIVTNMEHIFGHLRENQQDIDTCVKGDPEYKKLLKSNAALAASLAG